MEKHSIQPPWRAFTQVNAGRVHLGIGY